MCLAATAEVALVELRHLRLGRSLKRAGFAAESYFETRYLLTDGDGRHAPATVLAELAGRLGLPERYELHIEDIYLPEHCLREANGRMPAVRLRTVRDASGCAIRRALQVTFTRPGEVGRDDPSLFRCFAVDKEKFVLALPTEGDAEASEAYREAARRLGVGRVSKRVGFSRLVARDRSGLYLSADTPGAARSFWVEAKVRRDLALLKEANATVATHFPVRGTTQGKFRIVERMAEFQHAA